MSSTVVDNQPLAPAESGPSPGRAGAPLPQRAAVRAARYGLALLSGVLLVLCFPSPDQGWLVWLALVPLFVALQRGGADGGIVTPVRGARLGLVTGAMLVGGILSWVWIFGWYAWLALTAVDSLRFALFGGIAALLLRRAPASFKPAVLAAAWTVVEWLRSLGGLGLTWGDLAVSQHRILPILQMLDWTGPYGLTFLIALVNAALAAVVLEGWRGTRADAALSVNSESALAGPPECGPPVRMLARQGPAHAVRRSALRQAGGKQGGAPGHPSTAPHAAAAPCEPSTSHQEGWRWLAGAVLTVAVLAARGEWMLAQPASGSPMLSVAVLQGNINQDTDWNEAYVRRSMETFTRLTWAAARVGARLVVWPESSLPGELRYDPALEGAVEQLARAAGVELVIGSNDHTGDRDYNCAFLVDRLGHVRGHYSKRHLVPFGEYVPLGVWFPFLEALHVRPYHLTPGEDYYPVHGEEHALGTVICFESAFPPISRAMALHGAELLVEISNDTWFGRSAAAEQHAAMATLRAVETRRAFARATVTGISTLVDDHGRVRRRLGLFREGFLVDRLPLRRDLTPYVRLGDWPVLLALLLCLVGCKPRFRL
jgi:apolipoprotein N-acyltransferase